MITADAIELENSYADLGNEYGAYVEPDPFENPTLIAFNDDLASQIGFPHHQYSTEELADIFGAKTSLSERPPYATVYSGHQFGGYTPRLGDGRALLLGELINHNNERWDIQLKGAGLTPFSRMGDGRAVLRSTIREYLCSEAMHNLGIPTTRALAMVGSDHPVYREEVEKGAMLARASQAHIRFGHFEYFYYTEQPEALKKLADYTIDRCYPHLSETADSYEQFFKEVSERTARLMAQWLHVGFTHGVMNTDNMSILGETIDYGPYGFMNEYESLYIPNHSDHHGRYAYARQGSIGHWNIKCLGHALQNLIDEPAREKIIGDFERIFSEEYFSGMAKKFGLINDSSEIKEFIKETMTILEDQKADYTRFFRFLSSYDGDSTGLLEFMSLPALKKWREEYNALLANEQQTVEERHELMKSVNPKYILRNYMLQTAIKKAEAGDYSEIHTLHTLCKRPFDEQPDLEQYSAASPDWGKKLVISCSS